MKKQTTLDPRSGIILKGISEILSSIGNNIPGLHEELNSALRSCTVSMRSGEFSSLYSNLSTMAKFINNSLSSEVASNEESLLSLSSKLNLFENQLLSAKERETLISLHRKIKSKEISIQKGMTAVGEVLVNITDNSKALTSRNFGNESVKRGEFSEGAEKVLQSDLAVSTRRLGRDLERLSLMVSEQHPNDKELTSIRGQVIELKATSATKFFEALDILSKLTWAIYRINNSQINQDKEDLKTLANSFRNFADGMSNAGNINSDMSSSLASFEADFSAQMKELEKSGNNAKNLADLKAKLMANMEKMQKRTIEFSSKQQGLIANQKEIIQEQTKSIETAKSKLNNMGKELAKVKSDSIVDKLSNLNNRKNYDDDMANAEVSWKRKKEKTGLILIDIDLFKSINDQHGHQVGDRVITWMGSIINLVTKKYPNFKGYRYGGEEFAIIAEDASLNLVMNIAKWVNKFLKEKLFRYKDIQIEITASVGVSFFINKDDDQQTVFYNADKALYRAKEAGRNQVWASKGKGTEVKIGP